MTTTGEFKYVTGWFAVVIIKGLIQRVGPFETQEEAKAERERLEGK
jgi:hypothetical protein